MRYKNIVFLEISSWVGIGIGAQHYYGTLQCEDKREKLSFPLSKREAIKVNKRLDLDGLFSPGDDYGGFESRNKLIVIALQKYEEIFPEAIALIEGSPIYIEPMSVLDGPPKLKEIGNLLYERAEANDWWEGDEDKMNVISDQWKDLMREFGE